MKRTLFLIFGLLPLSLVGQDLECCKSVRDIESNLSGKWIVKNSDSKTIYHYWFENGQGNLTEIESTKENGKYLIIDNHPFVDVIKHNDGFKLKFTHLYRSWESELKVLNSTMMILVTDGEAIEYIKI